MEINKLLTHLRKLECRHIKLVGDLAKVNKPLAASMLNVNFDVIDGLNSFSNDELTERLMTVFEINRRCILTINSPLELTTNDAPCRHSADCLELTQVKANERRILIAMRELALNDIDVAVAICKLTYEDAAELVETPADVVEECVYANHREGLLKLVIRDMRSLKKFMNVSRLSYAGIQFDRLVCH